MSSQKQSAGDGSAQYQAAGDIVIVQGVTEARAREIALETQRAAMESFSLEAQAEGSARIEDFVDRLIPILNESNRMGALGDPAIQMALRRAQLGAAATDKPHDHDMLAELIAARIDTASDRQSSAGIDRAVEVVDKLDPAALSALTVFHAVSTYTPVGGDLTSALASQDALFRQFLEFELPSGAEWLDHLDILNLVRPSAGASTLKPASQFFTELRPGLVSPGIAADDPRVGDAIAQMVGMGLRVFPIPHELKPGSLRLPFGTPNAIKAEGYGLHPSHFEEASKLAADVFQLGVVDPELVNPFMDRWRAMPALGEIASWWDQIPDHFATTAVGRVLVDANIKRLNRMTIVNLT